MSVVKKYDQQLRVPSKTKTSSVQKLLQRVSFVMRRAGAKVAVEGMNLGFKSKLMHSIFEQSIRTNKICT